MVADDEGTHAVELCWSDGRTETVRVGSDETVVDAAEAAEIALPYGCLYGACGTCIAELLDGEMTHRRSPRALKDRTLEAGYVLPCIATPETDCRLRIGHDIQAEVVGTPWK
ncbi:2Fe-2S iron-sulfur cluster-binding protein [Halobellus ordinarius]|uniref:2Fe-2S iron-sulfur cluster-binding protein n=1 Tax=Halobellus ordinarius TaxID=3075120 RepID=UPI002880226F|nr:2Fe-2S iron-sulfur cluster-binding protein [Halobellus sp. ZY16]